jgi:DNA-directed RNA polymerase specialized sigma24 family protein
MSVDDRFRDVDWELILYKLTLRARQLFATARAKGYGNALARAGIDAGDLARSVIAEALKNERVKYKATKGASLSTFLSLVLERDFKDLLRKGKRLHRRLDTLGSQADRDGEGPSERGLVYDIQDDGKAAKIIELRAAALQAADGQRDLEDYVTAAFDFAAVTRADQAACLEVTPSQVTNLRKKFLRLLSPTSANQPKKPGGEI